jgi:hypothetical protein
MSLRTALEAFPPDAELLIFTTLGHVYSGVLADLDGESVTLGRPGGAPNITLNLADVSGVRLQSEEAERTG